MHYVYVLLQTTLAVILMMCFYLVVYKGVEFLERVVDVIKLKIQKLKLRRGIYNKDEKQNIWSYY